MKIYEKYLIKLLFARFWIILCCTSIFGIFQEMSKGELLAMCSFNEMMLILPLTLPMLIFQFLPFIYLGTLILVLNEIYSNNELISFKVIGFSNKNIMKVFFYFASFVLLFFVFLGVLYPATNKLFFKQRNYFGASNVLKSLQPNKMNRLGKYNIFFTDIDKDFVLNNVSIIFNNNDRKTKDRNIKKVIYSKKVSFGYNEFDELVARCDDNYIFKLDMLGQSEGSFIQNATSDNLQDEKKYKTTENTLKAKNMIYSKTMDVFFENFFSTKSNTYLKLKQKLRQTGIITLYKQDFKNKNNQILKLVEFHGRAVIYWFVLLCLTAICCLLLTRQTNRIPAKKPMLIVIVFGGIVSLSRAFFLEPAISSNLLNIYYLHFLLIFCLFLFVLYKKDGFLNKTLVNKEKNQEKIMK